MPFSERTHIRVAAVVLAAGFSRRLGRPKQELVLRGETLLQHAVRMAEDARLAPVIVVVQAQRQSTNLPAGAQVVINGDAAEGMASSVRHGVAAAQQAGATGVVVLTCDQPLLTAEHLEALCAEPHRMTASAYAGRRGVPAYFPNAAFDALLQLRGDEGARTLLRGAATVVNEALALDIDTEEDLQRALHHLAHH